LSVSLGVIEIKRNKFLSAFVVLSLALCIVLTSCSNKGANQQNESSQVISSEAIQSQEVSEIISSEITIESEPESTSAVQSESKPTTSQPTSSTVSSTPAGPAPTQEKMVNGILIMGTRALELVGRNATQEKKYAEYVNKFADDLSGTAKVYSMVIPKASVIYTADSIGYKNVAKNGAASLENIKNNLTSAINVDAYTALNAHKGEEIYARTDHHWTAYGAFYAAQEFAKVANTSFDDISTYTVERRANYVGTMRKYTNGYYAIVNYPEDFIKLVPSTPYTAERYSSYFTNPQARDIFYHISDSNVSSWYLTFIGGDSNFFKIKSQSCTNGRKLFIIKDSYGNALAPFFMGSFEEIYIVDLRELSINAINFVKEQGITDVLFAMCSYSALGSSINSRINTIRTM